MTKQPLLLKLLGGKTKKELSEEGYSKDDIDKVEKEIENARKRQFDLSARETTTWVSQAAGLKRAADKLFDIYYDASLRQINPLNYAKEGQNSTRMLRGDELEDFLDSQLISEYFLLMGFAVENLLKGILLTRYPDILKSNGSLPNTIKTHDLVGLSHKCDLKIEEKEKSLLDKLKIYILWQGKYPVPLSVTNWKQKGEPFRKRITQQELNHLYDLLLNELTLIK